MARASGTVLENLSTRKLLFLVLSLAAVVLLSFLIGMASPKPATVLMTLFTACREKNDYLKTNKFVYRQKFDSDTNDHTCRALKAEQLKQKPDDHASTHVIPGFDAAAESIMFVAEIPRSNALEMSPYHQFLIALADFQVQYLNQNRVKRDVIYLDVKLGARNNEDSEWTLLAEGEIKRNLLCNYPLGAKENEDLPEGYNYDCVPQGLFQLGATAYQHYLVNIKISPKNMKGKDSQIGNLYGIMMPVIFQNSKYTKILFSMKSLFTPFVLFALVWFWQRVRQLQRRLELMEKSILFVGVMLLQLDFPIDWLSLFFKTPAILFISDIRQGLFYASLLSFWLIFTGEHLVQSNERNNIKSYWRELIAITFSCACLFLFDSLERGVQIVDPFYTVWSSSSEAGYNMALGLIVMGAISGTIYLCFLFYKVFRVFQAIKRKSREYTSAVSGSGSLSSGGGGDCVVGRIGRQRSLEGIVFRFKFFMGSTLLLATITIAFFLLIQVQGSAVYVAFTHEYSVDAVFSTGVFGMWNVYAVALLFLYAPSHRDKDEIGFSAASATMFQLTQDDSDEGSNKMDNDSQQDQEDNFGDEEEEDNDSTTGELQLRQKPKASSQRISSREGSKRRNVNTSIGESTVGQRKNTTVGTQLHQSSSYSLSSSNIDDDGAMGSGTGEERTLVATANPQQPSIVYTMLGKQNLM